MAQKIATALISVFDKTGLVPILKELKKFKVKILSSGGTYKAIIKLGYDCTEISKYTGFKEMLDGRVKTLNPLIYASLLYKRDNTEHKKQFLSLNIPEINIVIVNLYPFKKLIKTKKRNKTIEMIDIGGPSLLRAASKNYKFVTAIIDTSDYPNLINNIEKNNGKTDILFRKNMAYKVFKYTSNYDKIISNWFNDVKI